MESTPVTCAGGVAAELTMAVVRQSARGQAALQRTRGRGCLGCMAGLWHCLLHRRTSVLKLARHQLSSAEAPGVDRERRIDAAGTGQNTAVNDVQALHAV